MPLADSVLLGLFQGLYANLEEIRMSQTAGQQQMEAAFARLGQQIDQAVAEIRRLAADVQARGDDIDPGDVASRLNALADRLDAGVPDAPAPSPPTPPAPSA